MIEHTSNNVDEQVSSIMAELGLNTDDSNARKIIARLLQSKPDVAIDSQFMSQLRNVLQAHGNVAAAQTKSNQSFKFTVMFVNRILASALIVMVVLAGGGFWYIQNKTDKPLFTSPAAKQVNQVLSGKYGVSEKSQESFGDLSKVSIINTKNAPSLANNSTAPNNKAETATMKAFGGGDTKYIAPGEPYPIYDYSFRYDGKDLPQLGANQFVLRRTLPQQQPSLFDRIVSTLSFGLIDLTKFRDTKVQSLSFVEDHQYGYSVGVDMVNGSVNLSQNWEKWPQPDYSKCAQPVPAGSAEQTMPACGPQPLKIGDIPADDVLFKSTNAFLDQYGISREAYGNPKVDNSWRIYYDQAPESEKQSIYIPEQLNVIYPLILDGQQVFDESGNPYGMNVTYDVRNQKVASIYELTTHQYDRSQYTGVTNSKIITDYAERGGWRNQIYPLDRSIPENRNAKSAVLKLDTPTVKLVKMYYTDPNQPYSPSNSGELYVPALVFPIKNYQEVNYWRSSIIVPLVKDIFDSDQTGPQTYSEPAQGMGGSAAGGSAEIEIVSPSDLPKNQN